MSLSGKATINMINMEVLILTSLYATSFRKRQMDQIVLWTEKLIKWFICNIKYYGFRKISEILIFFCYRVTCDF